MPESLAKRFFSECAHQITPLLRLNAQESGDPMAWEVSSPSVLTEVGGEEPHIRVGTQERRAS